MKNVVSKQHHYIPQVILRNFCFQGETLYYHYKNALEKGVQKRNVRSVFKKKHLNSFAMSSGVRNDTLETFFSKEFDDKLKAFIGRLQANIANNFPAEISENSFRFFVQFLYNHMRRTPELHQSVVDKNWNREEIRATISKIEQKHGPLDSSQKDEFLSDAFIEEKRDQIRVEALKKQTPEMLNKLANKGFAFGSPKSANKQFIVGSCAAVKFTEGSLTLESPDSEVWTTLAPNLAVGLAGLNSTPTKVLFSDAEVRKMNIALATNSLEIAGSNRLLINSLSNPR